ncbi:hypothetical protein MCERE19_03386 [Spirosomataceae bacterium]|jgi:uncharacterized protein YcfL
MKKLLLGLLLATIAVSCKSEKNMETNDHQTLVKTYFEHFNAHNWQKCMLIPQTLRTRASESAS